MKSTHVQPMNYHQKCRIAIDQSPKDYHRISRECADYYRTDCVEPEIQKAFKRQRYQENRQECVPQQMRAITEILLINNTNNKNKKVRVALYYHDNGKIFLVCVKVGHYPDLTIPGGSIDPGEGDELVAAGRELFEETRRCVRGNKFTHFVEGYPTKPETLTIDINQGIPVPISYNNYEIGTLEKLFFVRITYEQYRKLITCYQTDLHQSTFCPKRDPYQETCDIFSVEIGHQLANMMLNGLLQINPSDQRFDESITIGLLHGIFGPVVINERFSTINDAYQDDTSYLEPLMEKIMNKLIMNLILNLKQRLQ
jgi:8-oxo-dGTP pyrophosphatase MutT (NUDIX family)